jgi:hypothetical protein
MFVLIQAQKSPRATATNIVMPLMTLIPYIDVEQPRSPYILITGFLGHIWAILQQRRAFPILRHDLAALERRLPARNTERKDKQ